MARPTMALLIGRVRSLIFDADGTGVFTDDQISDALDLHRLEARFMPLRPSQTFVPGGGVQFLDFYSDAGAWEKDIVLQDASFNDITAQADVNEYLVGHWHFPTQPIGIAVRATGKVYDLYAAAADLLDAWAARAMLEYDVTVGAGQTFSRSQKFKQLQALAQQYRSRAMPVMGRIIQSDQAGEHVAGGVTFSDTSGTYGTEHH